MTCWYELAKGGTSDMRMINFSVLVRYVDRDSGLIAASLLDMPNINSGSTTQQIYVYRETFSLDWDNCETYSSDNRNSMTGQHSSLLQKIQGVEGDQKIFAACYLCHLAHLSKGDNKLTVNVENFVIDIYHNFCRSEKLKK